MLPKPVWDGSEFNDACLAILDCDHRPVPDKRIVDAEHVLPPPTGWAEGVRHVAELFHRGQDRHRLDAVALFNC